MRPVLRLVAIVLALVTPASAARLATEPADFVQPGTQPSASLDNFIPATFCQGCHGAYATADTEPNDGWAASMMAQSARDPVVRAAAAIANQDAAHSGETCIRCHAPIGWLAGRSVGADFASLEADDRDGVSCHVCHRMLDPIARAGAPPEDGPILAALDGGGVRPGGTCRDAPAVCRADADCPASDVCEVDAGQGRFVVDPVDSRRGPFAIPFASHPTVASAFHRRSDACAPCHDVSTPTYSRGSDGGYTLNDLDAPHPTQRPEDMFPEQRTYGEWRASEFARGGVVFPDGRFGGALTALLPNTVPVSTCQDCHMPDAQAAGCDVASPRPDLPTHYFAGANSWVLGAVLAEYGSASGLTEASVAAAHERVAAMLAAASDVEATQMGTALRVRVTNETGHKLPTGYPEGRRMWLNVRFFEGDALVAEDGAYDTASATLDLAHTTKTYEARHRISAGIAATVGLAAGTPFHLVLNDEVGFDDRIPPRGFTNAAFAAIGAAPAGYSYADGQHWDETDYPLPPRATRAEVTLYHQTTTREYAEFLRDNAGGDVHARWEAAGRSAPVVMSRAGVTLVPLCAAEEVCCARPDGAACDDADACTSGDRCAGAACAGNVGGFDGVRCEIGRLERPGPCAGPLPRKLQRFVSKRARKAKRLVAAAARRAENAARLLARAGRALEPLPARALAAVGHGPESRRITAACAERVAQAVGRATDVLRTLP